MQRSKRSPPTAATPEGRAGLRDRSSSPHHSPRRTHELITQFMEVLRRQRWTGMHIAQTFHLSRATVFPHLTAAEA